MLDIRLIRDDPAAFDAAMARRGKPADAATILDLDRRRREVVTELQVGQARRNEASKAIGAAKAKKDEDTAAALMAEVATLKQRLPELEAEEAQLGGELDGLLASLPNLPLADVPEGADEDDNQLIHERGQRPSFAFTIREHDAIGPAIGLDFETGALLSGAREARRLLECVPPVAPPAAGAAPAGATADGATAPLAALSHRVAKDVKSFFSPQDSDAPQRPAAPAHNAPTAADYSA